MAIEYLSVAYHFTIIPFSNGCYLNKRQFCLWQRCCTCIRIVRLGLKWKAAVKRAGIRRRNPYHTRHTFACWLLSAGANPSFIANQMGHENAKMVYEVYSTWIEEMNGDQVSMLNARL